MTNNCDFCRETLPTIPRYENTEYSDKFKEHLGESFKKFKIIKELPCGHQAHEHCLVQNLVNHGITTTQRHPCGNASLGLGLLNSVTTGKFTFSRNEGDDRIAERGSYSLPFRSKKYVLQQKIELIEKKLPTLNKQEQLKFDCQLAGLYKLLGQRLKENDDWGADDWAMKVKGIPDMKVSSNVFKFFLQQKNNHCDVVIDSEKKALERSEFHLKKVLEHFPKEEEATIRNLVLPDMSNIDCSRAELYSNTLTSLPWLGNHYSCWILHLNFNEVTNLDNVGLSELGNLRDLSINCPKLRTLPYLGDLTNLQLLWIIGCHQLNTLQGSGLGDIAKSGKSNFTQLYAVGNQLRSLDGFGLRELLSLKKLFLHQNPVPLLSEDLRYLVKNRGGSLEKLSITYTGENNLNQQQKELIKYLEDNGVVIVASDEPNNRYADLKPLQELRDKWKSENLNWELNQNMQGLNIQSSSSSSSSRVQPQRIQFSPEVNLKNRYPEIVSFLEKANVRGLDGLAKDDFEGIDVTYKSDKVYKNRFDSIFSRPAFHGQILELIPNLLSENEKKQENIYQVGAIQERIQAKARALSINLDFTLLLDNSPKSQLEEEKNGLKFIVKNINSVFRKCTGDDANRKINEVATLTQEYQNLLGNMNTVLERDNVKDEDVQALSEKIQRVNANATTILADVRGIAKDVLNQEIPITLQQERELAAKFKAIDRLNENDNEPTRNLRWAFDSHFRALVRGAEEIKGGMVKGEPDVVGKLCEYAGKIPFGDIPAGMIGFAANRNQMDYYKERLPGISADFPSGEKISSLSIKIADQLIEKVKAAVPQKKSVSSTSWSDAMHLKIGTRPMNAKEKKEYFRKAGKRIAEYLFHKTLIKVTPESKLYDREDKYAEIAVGFAVKKMRDEGALPRGG